MPEILRAEESRPAGKIILTESVLICFHFCEDGLPPNCWLKPQVQITKNKAQQETIFIIGRYGGNPSFHCSISIVIVYPDPSMVDIVKLLQGIYFPRLDGKARVTVKKVIITN